MSTRRRFLLQTPALAAGTLASGALLAPAGDLLRPHAGTARGVDVTPFLLNAALFVRVRTSEGVTGWGEADRAGAGPVVVRLIEYLKDHVVGRDVFAAEPILTDLYYRSDDMGRGGLLTSAIAGIDMALWDARGKLLGVPVYQLLGGAYRDRIPLYGSFSRDDGENTPADVTHDASSHRQFWAGRESPCHHCDTRTPPVTQWPRRPTRANARPGSRR